MACSRPQPAAPIPIRNPYTGEIYSDGIVPASQISAFAKKVFSQLPDPTTAGFSNNYQALPRVPTVDNKGDIRVDHYFSSRLTVYFRYSIANTTRSTSDHSAATRQ